MNEADAATIRGLRIAGGDFAPPLLADLADIVADAPASDARLQIDLKQPLAGLTQAAIDRFADIVTPIAERCLLSGTEWEAVRVLGNAVPKLALGFDPLDLARGRRAATRDEIAALVEEAAAIAPDAAAYYLHYKFVLAALAHGENPIRRLQRGGAAMDVWTPRSDDTGHRGGAGPRDRGRRRPDHHQRSPGDGRALAAGRSRGHEIQKNNQLGQAANI